jgi:hypothetical protein
MMGCRAATEEMFRIRPGGPARPGNALLQIVYRLRGISAKLTMLREAVAARD